MPDNWNTITESQFPWEREALEFIRKNFPCHEPYRAWSNFEFIAHDGSVNEVDLLVFSPLGFFLIEIKSHEGRLFGDPGTWTIEKDGKFSSMDNPYPLANLKAKKLRSLLEHQKAARGKHDVPWMDAIVFLSAEKLDFQLTNNARSHVVLRDRPASENKKARDGILATITHRKCHGLQLGLRGTFDKPTSKMVAKALSQAGIRPSQRHRKVGDYQLKEIIGAGPGYQDWNAEHVQLKNSLRRIRIYNVRANASPEERETLQRAAKREAELLEGLHYPGVLRNMGYTTHELGPALIFEHQPKSIRLDHYIKQNHEKLTDEDRCNLLRSIAEVIKFAHAHQTYHRGLSPQSILVNETDPISKIKIFNWQLGFRNADNTQHNSRIVTATSHIDRLIDDSSKAYLAPEAVGQKFTSDEKLDVFSLGAIAYFLFAGEPPAENEIELGEKLRDTEGLQISGVRPVGQHLQEMIQWSTHPVISSRIVDSAVDFLEILSTVEQEIILSEQSLVEDPSEAKPGDLLADDCSVIKRIGHGASSYAFLVEKSGERLIAKVAASVEVNERIKEEGEALAKLRHPNIADFAGTMTVKDRNAIFIRPAIANKDRFTVETLRQRLKNDGSLHIEFLQRFGDDLLGAVSHIEEQGYNHRDIKPDNIAVGKVGSGDRLHLVLFDFSLTRVKTEDLQSGTPGYLDPLLPLRKTKQWDSYAERYAAAVTLYQMATGPNNFPKWSSDGSDPTQLDTEAEIEPELFAASLRDQFIDFFEKAFARDISSRHDNAEQMKLDWNDCFRGIEEPGEFVNKLDEKAILEKLKSATLETRITDLGLGVRAVNALDRNNIVEVEDLLSVSLGVIQTLKGVGHRTRRQIDKAIRVLRENLEAPNIAITAPVDYVTSSSAEAVEHVGIDQLFNKISNVGKNQSAKARGLLPTILGVDPKSNLIWPGNAQLAEYSGVDRSKIHEWMVSFQKRWAKDAALKKIRDDISELLETLGNVMTVNEVASALLVRRGCAQVEPLRTQYAMAVTRAAIEVERAKSTPRFLLRRNENTIIISSIPEMGSLAFDLGATADEMVAGETIVSPSRALQQLRAIDETLSQSLSDSRLIRLATSASSNAALSSLNELYPVGMSASRAIKLSQNALYGSSKLTVKQLRERIHSRYPKCADIPDPPALDRLLEESGFDYKWNGSTSCYESPEQDQPIVTNGSVSFSRNSTALGLAAAGEVTPEIADARQFEERINRAEKSGSFLVLNVDHRLYQLSIDEIQQRCDLEVVDLEQQFIENLRIESEKAEVSWKQLLEVDADPGVGHWPNLMILVERVLDNLEKQILSTDKTVLLVYSGVLDPYGKKQSFLASLEQHVGRELFGLWVLIPGHENIPTINGRTLIPKSWLENKHRGATV